MKNVEVFEGNLLRFKALALEKLYESKRKSSMTLCNAILIAKEVSVNELQAENVYGTALAKF